MAEFTYNIEPKYETPNKVPLYSVWFNSDILIENVPFKDAIDVYLNLKRIGEESKKPYTRKMEVTSYIYTAAIWRSLHVCHFPQTEQ